jgi:fused signal recognition particle receptor
MGAPFPIEGSHEGPKPYVLLLIGVNGSGKTTTAGKLGAQFKTKGKQVLLAAADTFRAAAIEQLKLWGERTQIRVIAQRHGSDPASVAFDAIAAAKAAGADVVIVDTAGRLQAKHNLMEELGKIYRVIGREVGRDAIHVVLVLDSVMGQNGLIQAAAFREIVPVDSLILTKYDNTAKGGIILAIAKNFKIPIRYLGLGESVEDLQPFDPAEFIKALIGGEKNAAEH